MRLAIQRIAFALFIITFSVTWIFICDNPMNFDEKISQPKQPILTSPSKPIEIIDYSYLFRKNYEEEKEFFEKFVINNIISGTIKELDENSHKVYIDRQIWITVNDDIKENFAQNLAFYCSKGKASNVKIEIYDYLTGKKLARYNTLGFKMY